MLRKCYEILGLPEDAPLEQVKDAYRKLALEYHPDKHPNKVHAEEKMKQIIHAYSLIFKHHDKTHRPDRPDKREDHEIKIDHTPKYTRGPSGEKTRRHISSNIYLQKRYYPYENITFSAFFYYFIWLLNVAGVVLIGVLLFLIFTEE